MSDDRQRRLSEPEWLIGRMVPVPERASTPMLDLLAQSESHRRTGWLARMLAEIELRVFVIWNDTRMRLRVARRSRRRVSARVGFGDNRKDTDGEAG